MEEQTTPEPAPAPKKKRGFGKLLLIVIPMLLLAGGGGWWYLAGSGGAVAAEETSNIEERGVVPFEPFLVNLSDAGGNRFLKATIQDAQALVTTEGKKKLKEAIASAVAAVLKKQKVRDVLFSEFVVQF
jgi:flagellar basal body-associated protein FliL